MVIDLSMWMDNVWHHTCLWMILIAAAGNAFIQAAQIHSKAGNRHEAATQFVDAANCFKKTDANGNALVWYLQLLLYCVFVFWVKFC